MKTTAISLLLLIALLILCLVSAVYVNQAVTQTRGHLQAALELQWNGNQREALDQILLAKKSWEKRESLLGMLLRHNEVDSVHGELSRLEAYAKSWDQDDLQSTCAALIQELKHIGEMEWPTVQNIM